MVKMTSNNNLDLNSFNDVASYIAKANDKLSQGIVNSLKSEITTIRTEFKGDISSLASNLKSSVANFDSQQAAQSDRIERLEDTIARMQRNLELVISGIPVVADESCKEIVNKIATAIGFPLTLETTSAFRLHKSGSHHAKRLSRIANATGYHQNTNNTIHPLILIKFSSQSDKTNFIGKYLTYKSLSLKDIGLQSEQRIYIKENLTPSNYKIFQRCAAAKRDNLISKFHTRDGICYIALPSSDSMLAVHTIGSINDILGQNPDQNSAMPARGHRNKRKRDNENQPQPSSEPFGQQKKRRNHRNNTNHQRSDGQQS